jgi:hypothetical protein
MRNWLRQKLINILVDPDDQGARQRPARLRSQGSISVSFDDCEVDRLELPDPIRFRVQQVSGGTVIETKYYDHKKDEERVKLHIVTPEENLSESIGKIVTMELLQK